MRIVATVMFLCMAIARVHAATEDYGIWFRQDGKDLIITSQPSHQSGQFVVQTHVGTVTAKHVVLEFRYIYRAKSVGGEVRNQKTEVLWRLPDSVKKDGDYYEIKELESIYLTDQEIEKLAGCRTTTKSIDMSFIEDFCVEGEFEPSKDFSSGYQKTIIQNNDETQTHRIVYRSFSSHGKETLWGQVHGFQAHMYYYDNMILTRIDVPNVQYASVLGELKRRYKEPTECNTEFQQWEIHRGKQQTFVTVFCEGSKRAEVSGLPPSDTFTLDISRMINTETKKSGSNNAPEATR